MHRYTLIGCLLVLLSPLAGPVRAQTVVLELFTSQGCAACPPADALLGVLAAEDDIIALSLHVDYWDYLGWRDPLGSRTMTRRQQEYAALNSSRSIYTPQMIVQGQHMVIGHREADVRAAIEAAMAQPLIADVTLEFRGSMIGVGIGPTPALTDPHEGTVYLVPFYAIRQQSIPRGENAGRTVTYHNVVSNWMTLGTWSGDVMETNIPVPASADGVVVMVQDYQTGRILGAGQIQR